ncbi:MAG: hypothetical protein WC364_07600 [Eubacteriales bacterium]|jgi:hypothetical protein
MAKDKIQEIIRTTKEEASIRVAKEAKSDHEKLVKEAIPVLKALNEIIEKEREIYIGLSKSIGYNIVLFPLSNYIGSCPGREDQPFSSLAILLNRLRERGYNV